MSTDPQFSVINQAESALSAGVLDSWKEIASYLRRNVRTVQRWSRYEGLPIRYQQHRKGRTVYALKHEIEKWRETKCLVPARPSRPASKSNEGRPMDVSNSIATSNFWGDIVFVSDSSFGKRWCAALATSVAQLRRGDGNIGQLVSRKLSEEKSVSA